MIRIGVEGTPSALVADAEFAPADIHPFAEQIYQLLKAGFLRATSVGFQPERFTQNRQRGGYDFHEQSLHEFSIVNVPSNAACLARSTANAAAVTKWLRRDADVSVLDVVELDVTGADEIVLDVEPCMEHWIAARASRQRGEPYGDPAARRGHDDVLPSGMSRDDLRAAVQAVVRQVLVAAVRQQTARALSEARGRVD
jgi:hypothetical protein